MKAIRAWPHAHYTEQHRHNDNGPTPMLVDFAIRLLHSCASFKKRDESNKQGEFQFIAFQNAINVAKCNG